MRKEKEVGENFTVRSFIVCTHQLIWLGQLNQGGQIGRAGSLHGKMTNSCTLVSCFKGGYIIEGVITLIWILTEVGHEYVIWIEVVQKRVHWLAFVSMMLNL